MSGAPVEAAGTGTQTGAGNDVWAWLAARRRGTVYQPDPDDGGDDPNGCIPKLHLLLECGYGFSGRSLLSIGASSALYEAALAHQARRGACGSPAAPMSIAHLVDTDTAALEHARERFDGAGVDDLRLIRALAHEFAPERRYDAGFFLSLYHHYDRLGGHMRALGFQVLETIAGHCRTLFFETGQTGDRVPGAREWPALLEMAKWPSPEAWIETRVPELTGYDAFRRLGTNPATGRHLYAFWRARKMGPALSPGGAFGDGGETSPRLIPVEIDPSGQTSSVDGERRRSIDEVFAQDDAPLILDVHVDNAAPSSALAALAEQVRPARPSGCVLQLRRLDEIDAVPAGVDVCWAADAACEAEAREALTTAALSGVPLVSLPARWNTASILGAARAEGVRLAFAAPDGGPTITLA